MSIQQGDKAKDKITGFEGIIVAKATWLSGLSRIAIQSETLKDGLPTEPQWFDEFQIELMEPQKVCTVSRETGGPRPGPKRNPDPAR